MGRIATFALFTALVVSYTAAFGQKLDTTEAICALNQTAPGTMEKFAVPFGAQHQSEKVWRKTAPEDFHAVLALMQVVSVAPCQLQSSQEAKLSIRAIRLIERNPETGDETVVSEVTDFTKKNEAFRFDGELFPRFPRWYEGTSTPPKGGMLSRDGKALVIDMAMAPLSIYHGWTDPKVKTEPGKYYLVEMEVKLSGLARLQMGVDYWREIDSVNNTFDGKCQKSNNCEGHLSRWFGPTKDGGWQTIRTPDALKGK